jgi:Mg2+-importing ATPase
VTPSIRLGPARRPARLSPASFRTSGLTTAEAAARLSEDGPNAIGGSGRRTLVAILVSQVASPLVLILVAASLGSLVVGDAVSTAIILAIVAMSATLGFVQEARSETAVAALQARLTLLATVVRDGAPTDVPIHGVVRSDLVVLGAGDIVPADGRVIEADHLYVDEASLTGESVPAPKAPRDGELDPAADDDRDGLVFFGTSIVRGPGVRSSPRPAREPATASSWRAASTRRPSTPAGSWNPCSRRSSWCS